jgi:hypothetical protein
MSWSNELQSLASSPGRLTGRRLQKKWRLPLRSSMVAFGRRASLRSAGRPTAGQSSKQYRRLSKSGHAHADWQFFIQWHDLERNSNSFDRIAIHLTLPRGLPAGTKWKPSCEALLLERQRKPPRHSTSENQRRRNFSILTHQHVVRAACSTRVHDFTADAARENCGQQ